MQSYATKIKYKFSPGSRIFRTENKLAIDHFIPAKVTDYSLDQARGIVRIKMQTGLQER
jgi:hypothetical protein